MTRELDDLLEIPAFLRRDKPTAPAPIAPAPARELVVKPARAGIFAHARSERTDPAWQRQWRNTKARARRARKLEEAT